jgi:hypothetical protein
MLGNSATPKQDLAESAVFITSKYRYWLSLNASACNQIRLFYCSLRYSQPIKLSEMWSLLVAGCGLSKIDRRNHLTMRDWGSLNQQHHRSFRVFVQSAVSHFTGPNLPNGFRPCSLKTFRSDLSTHGPLIGTSKNNQIPHLSDCSFAIHFTQR